jgi:mannobiose 2-epimerase
LKIHSLDPVDFQNELRGNILPFWMKYSIDKTNGGFYGALSNDLQIHNEVPRSAILCTRILWSFAAAYRAFGQVEYLQTARYAYETLLESFWDSTYGGIYWDVDLQGRPVTDRKHHYAQAFAIYSLCKYQRASGSAESLDYARQLFNLLETHAYDPIHQGYIEGSRRDWSALEDMRLSEKDMNCRKSMNTMLHTLEAYTQLAQVWPDARVRIQLDNLIHTFLSYVIDPDSGHLQLFFDDQWNSLSDTISYGHDIECSWLLWEAAQVVNDAQLSRQAKAASIKLAEVVLDEAVDRDGSLFQELSPAGKNQAEKEWWTQAEGVVGFYNAYQLSGNVKFARAAEGCWVYIREKLIDHQYGDWVKRIRPDGTVNPQSYKVGPWECPYHHARFCLQMMERLKE